MGCGASSASPNAAYRLEALPRRAAAHFSPTVSEHEPHVPQLNTARDASYRSSGRLGSTRDAAPLSDRRATGGRGAERIGRASLESPMHRSLAMKAARKWSSRRQRVLGGTRGARGADGGNGGPGEEAKGHTHGGEEFGAPLSGPPKGHSRGGGDGEFGESGSPLGARATRDSTRSLDSRGSLHLRRGSHRSGMDAVSASGGGGSRLTDASGLGLGLGVGLGGAGGAASSRRLGRPVPARWLGPSDPATLGFGDFATEGLLGVGGLAQVLLARSKADGGLFAIKVMHKRVLVQRKLVRYAMREAELLAMLASLGAGAGNVCTGGGIRSGSNTARSGGTHSRSTSPARLGAQDAELARAIGGVPSPMGPRSRVPASMPTEMQMEEPVSARARSRSPAPAMVSPARSSGTPQAW